MKHALLAAISLFLSMGSAWAEPPRVATDIAPVQSLTAMVMGDLGTPGAILPPGASPHDHALRPSEATALTQADIVFWIGPELTPWLDHALGTLAGKAQVVRLLTHPDTARLPLRDGPVFDGRDADSTNPTIPDPHAWLNPGNAITWIRIIAANLAVFDPDNAATYSANAARAENRITNLATDIRRQLSDVKAPGFLAYHDSYQYFEHAFQTPAVGAILSGEAERPSPGRMLALADLVANSDVDCVLAEPGTDTRLATALFKGISPRIALADPIGSTLTPGPDLYPNLLQSLADALLSCDQ